MTNHDQSIKTKKSLADALKNTMLKKEFSKISVSELVHKCDINRNTFYYHFEDIFSLFKWMIDEEFSELAAQAEQVRTVKESFLLLLDYFEENIKILESVSNSIAVLELKRHFDGMINRLTKKSIDMLVEEMNISVDDSYKNFLCDFFTGALIRMGDLIHNGVYNKETALEETLLLFKVSAGNLLETYRFREEKPRAH